MEAFSSSSTTNQSESVVDTMIGFGSAGGRKSSDVVADLVALSSDEEGSDDASLVMVDVEEDVEEEDSDEDESEDEDFDEEEEEDLEKASILEDMWKLKKLVGFFQHPEMQVDVDGFCAGRSFFSRPSAPEVVAEDEDQERTHVLADAKALKYFGSTYLHPEHPIEVEATAFARNYFSQPWATEQESFGAAEHRAQWVKKAMMLKKHATFYRHPEEPVDMEPGTSMSRNYFLRASAPNQTGKEQALILDEVKILKQLASDYLHPERHVEVDSVVRGRSYYSRASAPEQEDYDYCKEANVILQEMQTVKNLAVEYMHPENAMAVDPAASGRNYFSRHSGPNDDDTEQHDLIMQDMHAMKKLAVAFAHPEEPVAIDPTASGRNYFSSSSTPNQEDLDYSDEREIIIEEMKELKQAALDYLHPEIPVEIASLGCRGYFDRNSALEDEDEDAEERELILKEMQALKKLAMDYMHPEKPLEVDPTAKGRNFFSRFLALEQEEAEEEYESILQDMLSLKKLAMDYMHPEVPVHVHATASARNYFNRFSGSEHDYAELNILERKAVLKEAALMKKMAVDFMHPEQPVSADPLSYGRNYYSRASSVDRETFMEAEQRARITAEAAMIKASAVTYLHPENPVRVNPVSCARNYFSQVCADESESVDEDERLRVLGDAAKLKRLASDFLHPERPVLVDPCMLGRNFFGRASAVDQVDDDLNDHLLVLMEELAQLKQVAVDYMHPEKPLYVESTAFGRNFFGRASALSEESLEDSTECANVLLEASALKKLAMDFAHPELPVRADATAFARNYFSRASALEQETSDEMVERACVLAEASALKNLAVDYHHPELPMKTTNGAYAGRNYFVRASASGVAEEITTSGYANVSEDQPSAEDHSQHDDYGHFQMDEEMFYDMRQSIVLPLPSSSNYMAPKFQSSKLSSEEEGVLSRSPSSVMLFTGALDDANHPPLPSMG